MTAEPLGLITAWRQNAEPRLWNTVSNLEVEIYQCLCNPIVLWRCKHLPSTISILHLVFNPQHLIFPHPCMNFHSEGGLLTWRDECEHCNSHSNYYCNLCSSGCVAFRLHPTWSCEWRVQARNFEYTLACGVVKRYFRLYCPEPNLYRALAAGAANSVIRRTVFYTYT